MEVLYTLKKKEPGYLFRTQSYERFQVILVLHNELRIESNGSCGPNTQFSTDRHGGATRVSFRWRWGGS